VLVGTCDDLVTPRTLGPFRDMAHDTDGSLAEAVDQVAGRDAVFGAVHQELAGRPTVMIVEDVHWADDATLDVLRYLAWRIPSLPSVLVLTYRDDELGDDHPLRRVLGALASSEVRRLALQPLSPSAVEELSGGRGAAAAAVLAATAGNPFFVTEVLANPGIEVPATVRDAVLARLAGLGEETQQALELLSTVPGRVERWLVERLLADPAALDEAERRGVLEADPGHVWFRHELARRAIERQLPSGARVACNRRVLAELEGRPNVELSRLAHHAQEAGDPEAVIRHGLAAAREAAGAGAFSEALAHYELVLGWSGQLPGEQLATVLEESIWVLYNLSRFDEAVARAGRVVALRERTGDPAALGQALTTLSRMRYMVNDPAGSEEAVTRAVALLEPLGDRPRLARAYTYLAAILKLTDRLDEAIARARQALELGEQTGQQDVVAHSLNYLGYALLDLGDPSGADHLRRSAAVAGAASHYEYAQRAYTNRPTPTWSRGCTGWGGSPSSTRRWPTGWRMPASTASPPTSTTWRRTAACCSPCGGAGTRPRPGCAGCSPARTPGSWPASACRPWGGCWPARATRPPGTCWSGPGTRPPGPTRSSRSRWPASPGSRRPGWPATSGPPPSWPGSRWSAPPAGGPSATTASCCATWPAAGTR
jgi:tetratricopeptide (TPR) repeat protein